MLYIILKQKGNNLTLNQQKILATFKNKLLEKIHLLENKVKKFTKK